MIGGDGDDDGLDGKEIWRIENRKKKKEHSGIMEYEKCHKDPEIGKKAQKSGDNADMKRGQEENTVPLTEQ